MASRRFQRGVWQLNELSHTRKGNAHRNATSRILHFSSICFVFQLFSTWALLFFFLHIFYIIRRPRHNHFLVNWVQKHITGFFSVAWASFLFCILYQYCNHKVETKFCTVLAYRVGFWMGQFLAGWAIGWADGSNIIVIFCGVCKQQFSFFHFFFS